MSERAHACDWTDAGPDRVRATWTVDGHGEAAELHVDPGGRLRHVRMQRWGNPDGKPFAAYPFGVDVFEERSFDGVRLPSHLRAGWWWGTDWQADGEFFRATITAATFS